MINRWYQEAVFYSVDVSSFQDSDGDGRGDLRGLISRLDYLSRLGVSCLWLNPIHPSPWRDNGYDISDYYGIHPALGSLGDFAELAREAQERGIRLVLDLVVNHTSDEHPWFKSAQSSPGSPYRDWYVWSAESLRIGAKASSSRASRARPGPSMSRRRRGTSTASMVSSPISTGPILPYARRWPRS